MHSHVVRRPLETVGARPTDRPRSRVHNAGEVVRIAEQLIRGPTTNAAALSTNTRKKHTQRKMFACARSECERFINKEALAQGMYENRRQQQLQHFILHRFHL